MSNEITNIRGTFLAILMMRKTTPLTTHEQQASGSYTSVTGPVLPDSRPSAPSSTSDGWGPDFQAISVWNNEGGLIPTLSY